jgi:pantothenate kinase
MDGFHLPNAVLEKRGLIGKKGSPETFDSDGYVRLIERLCSRSRETVLCPRYDRTLHEPVPDAIAIPMSIGLIVTEGNYLLLDSPPWKRLQALLDKAWYLDPSPHLARRRLLERHMSVGRTRRQAEERIAQIDAPNAKIVHRTRKTAHALVDPEDVANVRGLGGMTEEESSRR